MRFPSFMHLGRDADVLANEPAEPFDPFKALAAEGIAVPQPITVEPTYRFNSLDDLDRELESMGENDSMHITSDDFAPGVGEQFLARMGVISDGAMFAPLPDFAEEERVSEAVNPKEVAGSKKPGVFSVFPRWVSLLVGRVMETGASKYGKFNYRDTAIAASTYEDAMERHAQLWFDGEDNDPESGVSHLAHVIACATLLLDAQATGQLVDNRQKTGIVRQKLTELEELRRTLPFPGDLKV